MACSPWKSSPCWNRDIPSTRELWGSIPLLSHNHHHLSGHTSLGWFLNRGDVFVVRPNANSFCLVGGRFVGPTFLHALKSQKRGLYLHLLHSFNMHKIFKFFTSTLIDSSSKVKINTRLKYKCKNEFSDIRFGDGTRITNDYQFKQEKTNDNHSIHLFIQ